MGTEPVAPYFEDLEVGMTSGASPGLTITEGHAAIHQAIVGDRLRLALDAPLCSAVTGPGPMLAHPGLAWDIAIGQSSLFTQRVIGNLFYRGLIFLRAPCVGDTLRTATEVVALRQNSPRPGRAATGLAALRVRTLDQEDRAVLDFHRCAMLPLRDADGDTGRADDLDRVGAAPPADLAGAIRGWDLAPYRAAMSDPATIAPGWEAEAVGGDVVSASPELARLSLNVASAHHDETSTRTGRRLVYGGQTIGIACSQLLRAIPYLATILAWHSCDHLGPVSEGDTLASRIEVERVDPLLTGEARVAHLRVVTRALAGNGGTERDVLDWRLVAAVP